MEKILAAWNLKVIQEYLNIRSQLERHGKTDEDVRGYLVWTKKKRDEGIMPQFASIHCPKCNELMLLEPINSDPKGRDRINSPEFKSWWRCPNDQTVFYNTNTVLEEVNKQMAQSETVYGRR